MPVNPQEVAEADSNPDGVMLPVEQTHPDPDRAKIRALPWYLAHGVLTMIFALWTFGGSVFLLFLNELGLPKGQIGFLLSVFPFCGLLALGFAPLAERWGRKRVFLACFGTRNFVMASLLFLPWVLDHVGRTAGLTFLFVVLIVFAVLRAMGETASYPWMQEAIPNRVRGKAGGANLVLCLVASCVASLIAGHVVGQGTGLERFLVLLGVGAVLGVLGVAVMWWVPGGAPARDSDTVAPHAANMMGALSDRNFVVYLAGVGAMTVGSLLFSSFLPLYLKEQMGVATGTVVRLDIAAMAGGALSGLLAGWAADRVGSRPVLMPSAALFVAIPLAWLLVPSQGPHVVAWCALLYFGYGVTANALAIGAGRLLYNGVVPPEKSTAYMAIYYAWAGLTGGSAPLLAGAILSALAGWRGHVGTVAVDGFRLLFLLSVVLLAMGWWLCGRVKPDDRHTTRTVFRQMAGQVREVLDVSLSDIR